MKKEPMRIDKKLLNLKAMGISNRCYDKTNKKVFSIQFYDFDYGNKENISKEKLERIIEIFPYDLLLYKTKHGLHFISFALLHGLRVTKSRAIQTSKDLGQQDYWTCAKDLTLRVSPKWKKQRFSKIYKTISEKPKFSTLLKPPNQYRISDKHLEFYYKFMGLPLRVYLKYKACDKKNYDIRVYHYKTRD